MPITVQLRSWGPAAEMRGVQDFKNALRLKAHSHSNGATPLSNGSTAPEPNLQTQKLVLPLLMSQQLVPPPPVLV